MSDETGRADDHAALVPESQPPPPALLLPVCRRLNVRNAAGRFLNHAAAQ